MEAEVLRGGETDEFSTPGRRHRVDDRKTPPLVEGFPHCGVRFESFGSCSERYVVFWRKAESSPNGPLNSKGEPIWRASTGRND